MTREAYRHYRQVIDVTDFETIDFDEEIVVSIPKFAWVVARSYLSTLAQRLSSYAAEYFSNGYDTPSEAQMDTIKANIAEFLAAEVDVPNFIVGQIVMYSGSFLPSGFLWCNGQTFDAFEYTELYNVIGYTYGQEGGDPKVPNLQEKFPMGGSISHPRGETGGESEHTLTSAEMPRHGHTHHWFVGGTGYAGGVGAESVPLDTGLTGGDDPHNNMPPYLTIYFIIYTGV